MKVILKDNIESLGKAGDTVKVSDGYARNYLIPRGLAVEASNRTLKAFEHEKKQIMQKIERERMTAETLAERVKGTTCTIIRRVGEQDKLFGSVTTKDIEHSLHEQGFEIDKKMILLDEPIKATGEFPVRIKLRPGVITEIKVVVEAEV
ncbi:MAG: 50S ribosomal protein L9 [Deltaproteobacteria bacterium]|nr:50S ribosomal protein L9 [Deltaproteobacteria bacterium]